jgi:hypothetical protein
LVDKTRRLKVKPPAVVLKQAELQLHLSFWLGSSKTGLTQAWSQCVLKATSELQLGLVWSSFQVS